MTLNLSREDWIDLFPKAPIDIIDSFVQRESVLKNAGILDSRVRLSYCLANAEHECGGFTIPGLTESIKYSHKRMAQVWPKRFASASDVKARFGSKAGWQARAIDEIYGGRMGNRKGTNDGSTFIGRGAPQLTGRDAYRAVGELMGIDLENNPDLATLPENQPALLASFWTWKDLNAVADSGDFLKCVKRWNGGHNGLRDRLDRKKGNAPVISRLKHVSKVQSIIERLMS